MRSPTILMASWVAIAEATGGLSTLQSPGNQLSSVSNPSPPNVNPSWSNETTMSTATDVHLSSTLQPIVAIITRLVQSNMVHTSSTTPVTTSVTTKSIKSAVASGLGHIFPDEDEKGQASDSFTSITKSRLLKDLSFSSAFATVWVNVGEVIQAAASIRRANREGHQMHAFIEFCTLLGRVMKAIVTVIRYWLQVHEGAFLSLQPIGSLDLDANQTISRQQHITGI